MERKTGNVRISDIKVVGASTGKTPGYEAPVYICWARRNRSALIRIPEYFPGKEMATRVELRCPDPSCNPYLAFTVMLKAGLEGIRKKIEPPEPVEEDVYEFDDFSIARAEAGEFGFSRIPCTDRRVSRQIARHTK
jgi:glutamine synthetase